MAKRDSKENKKETRPTAGGNVKQADLPAVPLQQALRIANGLMNDFAGRSAAPHDVAFAIGMSPTSGPWRALCAASIAYGLTEGGYNANEIKLTQLGRRIVAPEEEGDDTAARAEAILRPRIMREFFSKYDRAKFPQDAIAANVLVGLGLPRDRATAAVEVLKEAGKNVGIIRETKTGLFVALNSRTVPLAGKQESTREDEREEVGLADQLPPDSAFRPAAAPGTHLTERVFITHGKSRAIVNQLKELLAFGQFEPVVSIEREATAVPVPDKVFDDMRSCSAGVIHVSNEGEMLDKDGKKHIHINHNVLIEIGAAIALYKKRVILLVEKGVSLPSNLQGLYRCEYEGDRLDYEATMKLLKTFSEFRGK